MYSLLFIDEYKQRIPFKYMYIVHNRYTKQPFTHVKQCDPLNILIVTGRQDCVYTLHELIPYK